MSRVGFVLVTSVGHCFAPGLCSSDDRSCCFSVGVERGALAAGKTEDRVSAGTVPVADVRGTMAGWGR